MTARTLLASAALAAGLVVPVAVAPSALALSCVGPDRVLDDAEVVYTGKVVDSGDGRVLVEVQEVWRGGPIEEEVWLGVQLEGWMEWAGPDGRIPDDFSTKKTWLFAPDGASISPCTVWAIDSSLREHVDEHRPAQPDAPVATSGTGEGGAEAAETEAAREQGWPTTWPVVGGLAGLLAAIGVVALVLGRRRGGRHVD